MPDFEEKTDSILTKLRDSKYTFAILCGAGGAFLFWLVTMYLHK